ncbi:MAG TPA: hypothetical protein VFI68_13305 [Anaerolineales bacterium]|nr:hypothetical protein [Anaerolineales bacterium]
MITIRFAAKEDSVINGLVVNPFAFITAFDFFVSFVFVITFAFVFGFTFDFTADLILGFAFGFGKDLIFDLTFGFTDDLVLGFNFGFAFDFFAMTHILSLVEETPSVSFLKNWFVRGANQLYLR